MTENIRISKGTFFKDSVVTFFKIFGYIFGSLIVVYLIFAMFLLRVVPSPDLGFTPIKNITYDGGIIPVGENVIVNVDNTIDHSVVGSLKQAVVPARGDAEVTVLSDFHGWITVDEDGVVSVNDKEIGVFAPPADKERLIDEYFVECVTGACETGDIFIISKEQVYGERLF